MTAIFSSVGGGKIKNCPFKVAFLIICLYNIGMIKFAYSFTRLTLILIIFGLCVCLAGFGVNLYVCISDGVETAANPAIPIVLYTLMFAVTVCAGGILLSILLFSSYKIGEKKLKMSFGIIKSSYDVGEIDTLLLDRASEKLYVVFKDESCMTVVIKKSQYTDFVQAVLDVNPRVEYAIQSIENTPDDNKKK